jgi:predicted dehydrogenase
MKPINFGIIGLGNQGKRHLQNCLCLKGLNVVAVADTSKSALAYAAKLGVKKTYVNYEDLLRDNHIDAVIITLPNFLHLESATKAAEAGKDVLLEKPLASSLRDGEIIVSNVNRAGVKLMVGYGMRFNPLLIDLREKIVDGFFGEVRIAEASIIGNGPFTPRSDKIGPAPVPNWWFDKESVGGGALMDLGVHMIDLFAWYFGEVASASSYLGYALNMNVEDSATCAIQFRNGSMGIINAGWFSRDRHESISLNGTSRCFSTILSRKSRLRFIWNDFKTIAGARLGKAPQDSSCAALEHFVNCLQHDVKPSPSAEDGLIDLQIVSMAYNNATILTC